MKEERDLNVKGITTGYLYPRHTKYAMGVYSFRLFCVCVCACVCPLTIFVSAP